MGGSNPVAALGSPAASEDTFKIYSHPSDVRFLTRAVQPPSAIYVDTSDVLVVASASSRQNEVITVSYRLLRADGSLNKGQFQVRPDNVRDVIAVQEPLAEGFLLSVSCKAAVATTRGQTFVRAFLTDPVLGPGQPSYMLMADYVTTAMAPAHPNGRVLTPVEGPGNPTTYVGIGGIPGSDFSFPCPTNARWRIQSLTATLTTAAGGPARFPNFLATTNSNRMFTLPAPIAEGPSSFNVYNWCPGTAEFVLAGDGHILAPIPIDLIIPGFIVSNVGISTFGLQGGDIWTNITLSVEEWLDNV